jgi:hypothetical protein
VLSSHIDGEVLEDLRGQAGALNSFEFEGLYELVLRSEAFTGNSNHTDVDTADELSNNKMVDGEASVICVVVVEAVVLWLQVVSSVEELADVGAASPFDDELTAGVIGSIVSGINDKVINKQQVTSSFASDRVKLFLSHHSGWLDKVYIGAHKNLVTDFHDNPWERKDENTGDPKVWELFS